MKMFLGVSIALWLLSGVVGAWMLDDLDPEHWKDIGRGPITLIKAFKDAPPEMYPGGV